MPADLQRKKWTDPEMEARVMRLIEALAPEFGGRVKWFMLGNEYFKARRFADALTYFRKALALNASSWARVQTSSRSCCAALPVELIMYRSLPWVTGAT